MATSNRTLIEKADLALSDLSSDGGYLTDQQADEFIRLNIKESVLLGQIAVMPMRGPREERDKIRFAGRVLHPGSPGTALPVANRSKPDLSKFTLDAQLFKAEVRMNDEILEDQIERGTFADTVKELLAGACARDIEYVAVQGDTGSATPVLAVLDGFIKQVVTNTVNAASAHLNKDILKAMLKTMPDEFAKTERMRFYSNRQARIDYRDSLANRATELGDVKILQDERTDRTMYMDMPIEYIPEWPDTTSTSVLLTDPMNMCVGYHRRIRFETDRDVSAGVNIVVATIRFDVKFEEETATVKATSVATT
jgi:hypothetical protein